jgi:hypothetical protein
MHGYSFSVRLNGAVVKHTDLFCLCFFFLNNDNVVVIQFGSLFMCLLSSPEAKYKVSTRKRKETRRTHKHKQKRKQGNLYHLAAP